MKVLASALALLLVGLTGVWLWVDATAEAGQDRAGVVITGEADLATTRELAEAAGLDGPPVVPGDEEAAPRSTEPEPSPSEADAQRRTQAGQVVDVLLAASTELRTRVRDAIEEIRAEEQAAEQEAAEREAAERAAAEREAAERAAAEREAAERAAAEQEAAEREAAQQAPAPQPVPVQPPPVVVDDDDDDWDDD